MCQRIDQRRDAQEETRENHQNDCAVEGAEPRLFGTIGRNDGGAYDITAFALAVSDFSHGRSASMAWAIWRQPDESGKIEVKDLV
jgi:hypothetical protein